VLFLLQAEIAVSGWVRASDTAALQVNPGAGALALSSRSSTTDESLLAPHSATVGQLYRALRGSDSVKGNAPNLL